MTVCPRLGFPRQRILRPTLRGLRSERSERSGLSLRNMEPAMGLFIDYGPL